MGLLISAFNGVRHFFQGIKHIASLIKKAARMGKQALNVLKNPAIILQILVSSLVKAVKDYAIIIFIVVFILSALLGMVVEGAKVAYDEIASAVTGKFGAVTGWLFGDKVKEETNKITEEQAKEMIEAGSPYDPRNMSKYIEVEQNTTPVKVDTKRHYKQRVWTPGGETNTDKKIDYELSLIEVAYDYRLPWEFVLGLDVINNTSLDIDYFSKKIVRHAEDDLKPIYTWGYDKYSKDVTYWDQTWQIKYKNGIKVYEKKIKEIETYNSYPLPILDKVQTIFKDYNFTIDTDQVTDTGWTKVNSSTYSWTEQEGTGTYKDTDGDGINDTEIMKTVHYSMTTYHKYRTKTVEDKVNYIVETQTGQRLDSFLEDFKLSETGQHEDISLLYEIVARFDNTESLRVDLEDYIGLEYAVGGATGNYVNAPSEIVIQPSELSGVVYFSQKDSRWGNVMYGQNTIRASGCGPTSMAMVMTSLGAYNSNVDLNNDSILDPYESAMWSYKNGYRASSGTYWSYFSAIGKKVGLSVIQKTPSQYKDVVSALESGKLVIASMAPGHFTKGGHFILLRGVDGNGDILVNDPNSTARSSKSWDFASIILPESKQFWIISN